MLKHRLTSLFTNPLDSSANTDTLYLLYLNQSMTMVMEEFSNTSDTYCLLRIGRNRAADGDELVVHVL